jgi:hypothetical protein
LDTICVGRGVGNVVPFFTGRPLKSDRGTCPMTSSTVNVVNFNLERSYQEPQAVQNGLPARRERSWRTFS